LYNNDFLGTEHDINEEYYEAEEFDPVVFLWIGQLVVIVLLGAGWRMVKLWRDESYGE
jgi:hypothetical protein